MRTIRRALLPALLGLAALSAAGCRYRTGGSLPADVNSIGVTVLRNQTRYPGLEGKITDAIISALNSQGRLKVVDAEGDPDLVLTGRVESYVKRSVRSDRYGDAVAFSVVIEVRITVRRPDGEYLFKNLRVSNRATDPESGTVDLGRGQSELMGRAEAVSDLGRNVARRIVEQGW